MNHFNNYTNIINNSMEEQNVYKKVISEKGLQKFNIINKSNFLNNHFVH